MTSAAIDAGFLELVAIHAAGHGKARFAKQLVPFRNLAMAVLARVAFIEVSLMTEIHE